jgi:hypothetical protein
MGHESEKLQADTNSGYSSCARLLMQGSIGMNASCIQRQRSGSFELFAHGIKLGHNAIQGRRCFVK